MHLHDWHQPTGASLFDHLSVWLPPPELARQCLIGILEAWVECPQSTGALLFIPRTLARCWLDLSRHIRLVDTIFPAERPLRFPPLLPIPILVLYLAPHTPSLPSHIRLDPSPKPKGFRWHNHEASLVRGISGQEEYLPCHFASTCFPLGEGRSIPCGVSYHPRCFQAGLPFTSQRSQPVLWAQEGH